MQIFLIYTFHFYSILHFAEIVIFFILIKNSQIFLNPFNNEHFVQKTAIQLKNAFEWKKKEKNHQKRAHH